MEGLTPLLIIILTLGKLHNYLCLSFIIIESEDNNITFQIELFKEENQHLWYRCVVLGLIIGLH